MAAIPSGGSLVATHDYYRRRLGSTSSNSSCGSTECSGEALPHHPGLPKSDPGHWWASFFFGKATHAIMTPVSESPETSGALKVTSGVITSGLAQEVMKHRTNTTGTPNTGPPPV
ncbi:pancreatic progenitor cell differentiation and proliferation factor B-like [Rhinatrema bivittatum]|uniref:pancreatic progenitor cell differentiation and proliferation factor n=1 Tax=Rhinatrema bivittatum TaxID=194408 RepID=UPI00112728FD|nr:pancreatic progenitor cell differentiation and proliferation factor [Rhinatrema bivittatum]XP_029469659.1 pancreatic progenitor cell differentiation and proliferation factor B-like [Rhinatrema bivittatum]